ncbi:hypothetical protein [Iningainema tapete]|uniref:Uncharacterized protein n=1 Tax=Iningainema tapete BLCC-T55 TaxID=2748662 RepID=A0A8J6XG37_9CYAN|nr:hypothetical protein [Iningainema tapete]MBD2771004.1 hypothetical protein [Iningainema tapete BLCC-T55]
MKIIWMFATHPKINHNSVIWVLDRELKNNMMNLLEHDSNVNEQFLARQFCNNLHLPLAGKHLSAYLEKVGYYTGNRVYRKFQHTPLRYEKQEIWQIAWYFASNPHEFFKKYDQGRPLENYAYKKMERKIKEEIFHLEIGRDQLSDWGLLRYSTPKSLQKALQHQGYNPSQHECYLLAYKCFKLLYAPQKSIGSYSLPAPTDEQWQAMANLYNQLALNGTANRDRIKHWLSECIQVFRNSQKIHVVSLDAPSRGEENSTPLSETEIISHRTADGEYEPLIMQELTSALNTILSDFLLQLNENINNQLLLRYGFDLDYRLIGPIFEVDYTTIVRRCNKAKQQLLMKVGEWSQQQLKITPDSEHLKKMDAALKLCWNQYYQDIIFRSVFYLARLELEQQSRHMLHLRYFRQMDCAAIASELQLSESTVSYSLSTTTVELGATIKNWLQNRLTVSPDLLTPLDEEIAALVQTLVANYPDPNFV